MVQRCPTSKYLGIARLNGYRWIINVRGYANIIEIEASNVVGGEGLLNSEQVWGLVYSLEQKDEDHLDRNEGVPIAYTKEDLTADFWQSINSKAPDIGAKPKQMSMLVYINRKMITPHEPKKEYVYRMNMGIRDALIEGMPTSYVENVLRKFIPNVEDETVSKIAKKQALAFEDEQ